MLLLLLLLSVVVVVVINAAAAVYATVVGVADIAMPVTVADATLSETIVAFHRLLNHVLKVIVCSNCRPPSHYKNT